MKYLIVIVFLVFTSTSKAWTPVVNFSLEESNYVQTLHWVSGTSYAYSSLAKEMKKAQVFCVESVSSEVILDILNSKYANTKITSEEAIKEIKIGLKEKFPCTKGS